MSTKNPTLERLLDEGIDAHDAELRLRDNDLWVLDPTMRFGVELEGEAGVEEWREAAKLASAFRDFATNSDHYNYATTMLIWDAAARAEEALRRAESRAGESTA